MNSINESNETGSKERVKRLEKEKHNVFFSAVKEGCIETLKASGIFLPGILFSFVSYPLFFPKNSRDYLKDFKIISVGWAKWTALVMAAFGVGGVIEGIHDAVSHNKDTDRLIDEELEQECAAKVTVHNQKYTKRYEQEKVVKAAALSSPPTPPY